MKNLLNLQASEMFLIVAASMLAGGCVSHSAGNSVATKSAQSLHQRYVLKEDSIATIVQRAATKSNATLGRRSNAVGVGTTGQADGSYIVDHRDGELKRFVAIAAAEARREIRRQGGEPENGSSSGNKEGTEYSTITLDYTRGDARGFLHFASTPITRTEGKVFYVWHEHPNSEQGVVGER